MRPFCCLIGLIFWLILTLPLFITVFPVIIISVMTDSIDWWTSPIHKLLDGMTK